MSAVYVECPECCWEGPHDGFALNEAECADCHCEFSYSTPHTRGYAGDGPDTGGDRGAYCVECLAAVDDYVWPCTVDDR